jgi:hypothetical protein
MTWTAYQVILRLHTPLHIGRGRVSYLQRARPYVTGRVLRGALVSRVGRNNPKLRSNSPRDDPYRCVSKTFAQYLTYTYFYPALKNGDCWKAAFPWDNEARFRRRFLSSYTAAALEYPQQTAAEGLLYETEFIAPYTLDKGDPVYLMGYIFVDEARLKCEKYDWQAAFRRLQLGGERGYGWGEARLADNGIQPISGGDKLFDIIRFNPNPEPPIKRPIVCLKKDQPVLAHTDVKAGALAGPVEPIVGREWRADNENKRKHVGQHLPFDGVRFAPGSIVLCESKFTIEKGGYWQQQPPQEGAP